MQRLAYYVIGVLLAIDILVNALLFGAHSQTISARIGLSIRGGGWACAVPWPAWFRAHCVDCLVSDAP